jgi:demethylmenaquinone methyltransferase/2-methoxy-6-polyprenyl-1,4-benzoquinol methylase
MPLAGKILVKNRDAYLYLPESIEKFPLPDRFEAMMREAGFTGVKWERLTNGIAVIYTGVKA